MSAQHQENPMLTSHTSPVTLAPFARYDDGTGPASYLAHTAGRTHHGLILGEPGSGKRRVLEAITRGLLDQVPAMLVHLDGRSGASSPALWEMATVRGGPDRADEILDGLEKQLDGRQHMLADHGRVGLEPTDDIPLVMVVLDETHILLDRARADRLAAMGRYGASCGLLLLAATQDLRLPESFAESLALRTTLLSGNRIALHASDTFSLALLARNGFAGIDINATASDGFNALPGLDAHPVPFSLTSA
jgi:hypothetical protein